MKKNIPILFVAISLIFTSVCVKTENVLALENRICIGDDCPGTLVSHYHYTNFYNCGLKTVTAGPYDFQYDYYIKTYLVFENGKLVDVKDPVVTHGDMFWSETADHTVSISQYHNASINKAQTSADINLYIQFVINGTYRSDWIEIEYTAY